jgi:hypothetical protein
MNKEPRLRPVNTDLSNGRGKSDERHSDYRSGDAFAGRRINSRSIRVSNVVVTERRLGRHILIG